MTRVNVHVGDMNLWDPSNRLLWPLPSLHLVLKNTSAFYSKNHDEKNLRACWKLISSARIDYMVLWIYVSIYVYFKVDGFEKIHFSDHCMICRWYWVQNRNSLCSNSSRWGPALCGIIQTLVCDYLAKAMVPSQLLEHSTLKEPLLYAQSVSSLSHILELSACAVYSYMKKALTSWMEKLLKA